jgi:glutamate-1-semialdehyde 2,1-aminomutase
VLRRPGLYERLEALAARLAAGLQAEAARAGVALTVNRVGSMFTPFFTPDPVTDYASAKKADTTAFGCFFRTLLERGVYLPPSQFEAAFVSSAHSEEDINATVEAAGAAFTALSIS